VGGALGHTRKHRQDRRGAIQRLDLAFLINAKHNRALGRIEVEPNDVADLLDELRIPTELPGLLTVRLEPERLPNAVHRGLVETDLGGHRARRPVRRVLRRRFKRLDDHFFDLGVGDLSGLPRPWLIG
jgi:hypothetical protein